MTQLRLNPTFHLVWVGFGFLIQHQMPPNVASIMKCTKKWGGGLPHPMSNATQCSFNHGMNENDLGGERYLVQHYHPTSNVTQCTFDHETKTNWIGGEEVPCPISPNVVYVFEGGGVHHPVSLQP